MTPIAGMRSTGRIHELPSRANPIGDTAFRLGQWRVDPAVNEISRNGTTVKLEPRTMRVLVCLAERAGDIVSVNELLDTVWKDLVVTQYSVYQAVAVLRRALGDNPKAPAYIASVPRRGYRLVAPIKAEAPELDVETPQPMWEAAPVPEPPPVPEPASVPKPAPVPEPASVPEPAAFVEASAAADWEPPRIPATEDAASGGRWRHSSTLRVLLAVAVAASAGWYTLHSTRERSSTVDVQPPLGASAPLEVTTAAFTPPIHSVAVLPFTNLSGDPKEEYFSDGMTEELINALAQIDTLKVIARTSSFSLKGKNGDIGTIARKLNVAAVLEGSVRRFGNKVRITAQLINAVNGFHIWSQDYDRDLDNVLALQTDIAKTVAQELQAKLLGDEAPKIELGGTRSADAFDAYLRGAKAYSTRVDAKDCQTAITAYTEAIRLDPNYALAFAGRSSAQTAYAEEYASGAARREAFDRAQADARQALTLASELAEGHVALGDALLTGSFEFAQAGQAYERALMLAPGNAQVLRESGRYSVFIGRVDAGLDATQRAVVLDPLNPRSHSLLGQALYFDRRYQEAVAAFRQVVTLDPDDGFDVGFRGLAYYGLGDLTSARSSCETKPDHWAAQWCLAITYYKLGRQAEADAVVARMKATYGNAAAYQYATIYAQWGNTAKSLEWLDTAVRVRDPGLLYVKTDPLLDPLRKEPRFRVIERALKFP